MTCSDLHSYFDGELDAVHSAEFEQHLRECGQCTAGLERLGAVRSAIRSHAPYYARQPRRQMAPAWVALAAAACIAGAFVLGRPSLDSTLENEVTAAHLRSLQANHLVDVLSTDQHTVKPWFSGKLDFAPEVVQPAGFELVGGRMDYLAGQPVAALVYKRRQHTVNVFTWPGAGADHGPKSSVSQGFHIVHWSSGGMHWWAISDAGEADLRQLAGEISPR